MRELPNTKEYEPYDLSLTLDKRFLFKNGKFAPFTLHDLIQINYSYHYECYSISELSDEYGISFDVIKRILSRYQKGDFDKFINDEYFKDLNEGELKNHYSRFEDFLKGKSADFTSLTMKGYSIAKSCEISNLDIDEVESWLLKGEKGLKPYDIFYDAFLESTRPSCIVFDYEHLHPWAVLALIARRRGVKTLNLMHAEIYSRYAWAPLLSSEIAVWGELQRKSLLSYGVLPEQYYSEYAHHK